MLEKQPDEDQDDVAMQELAAKEREVEQGMDERDVEPEQAAYYEVEE